MIVAGDFNTMDTLSRAETTRVFQEAGYDHASRSSGTLPRIPWNGPIGVVLDHVFVRGFTAVRSGTRPAHSSDHVPLFAELRSTASPESPATERARARPTWACAEGR